MILSQEKSRGTKNNELLTLIHMYILIEVFVGVVIGNKV